jgi:hypothetical protein
MIVVKIEMWPGGSEDRSYELGRTYIYNDGTGTPARGNYEVRVCRKSKDGQYNLTSREVVAGKKCTRVGRVRDWPRKSYNIWRLILRCLKSAFPEDPS